MTENTENDMLGSLKPIGDVPLGTAHGIAAVALSLALKYHDISTVKDGTLYQQYKLEGKNFRELHIDVVFETAIQIERHLLASSDRIAALVVEAVASGDPEGPAPQPAPT